MTQTVIFDLDGVLVDSEPLWQRGFADVVNTWLESTGAPNPGLAASQMGSYAGGRVNETLREILVGLGRDEASDDALIAQLTAQVVADTSKAFAASPTPIQSSVDVARELRARGARLAVCSSSAQEFIDTVIDVLGLEGVFETTASALELEHGKPHPQVYLGVLDALGVAAADCVAIEDSARGIGSAVAAGIPCVGLWRGGGIAPEQFDVCVRVTTDLTLADLEAVRS